MRHQQQPPQPVHSKPFLRLRAAFSRGNSESSFDVQHLVKRTKDDEQPATHRFKVVSFREERNEQYTDDQAPRTIEECRKCFVNRDDYRWYARDAALCIDSYRRRLSSCHSRGAAVWTDDDGVSSVRGLEEFTTRPRSSAEIRRAHAKAVLQAQERLVVERHDPVQGNSSDNDNNVALHEALRKVSMNSSKEAVHQALQLAVAGRDELVPPSQTLRDLLRRASSFKKLSST